MVVPTVQVRGGGLSQRHGDTEGKLVAENADTRKI
jgi:hypothetical protein